MQQADWSITQWSYIAGGLTFGADMELKTFTSFTVFLMVSTPDICERSTHTS